MPLTTPSLSRLRVLVVDDHVDSASMFRLLLECDGHDACMAHNSITALRAVEDFKPDFVFLDIGMPEVNGHQIAMKLRDDVRRKEMLLVALTGWGDPSDFEQSRRAGFDFHLVKPIDTARVRQLLKDRR